MVIDDMEVRTVLSSQIWTHTTTGANPCVQPSHTPPTVGSPHTHTHTPTPTHPHSHTHSHTHTHTLSPTHTHTQVTLLCSPLKHLQQKGGWRMGLCGSTVPVHHH